MLLLVRHKPLGGGSVIDAETTAYLQRTAATGADYKPGWEPPEQVPRRPLEKADQRGAQALPDPCPTGRGGESPCAERTPPARPTPDSECSDDDVEDPESPREVRHLCTPGSAG